MSNQNRVGMTGSNIEIPQHEITKQIQDDLKALWGEYRGGAIATCHKCSTEYQVDPALGASGANLLQYFFKEENECPYCHADHNTFSYEPLTFEYSKEVMIKAIKKPKRVFTAKQIRPTRYDAKPKQGQGPQMIKKPSTQFA